MASSTPSLLLLSSSAKLKTGSLHQNLLHNQKSQALELQSKTTKKRTVTKEKWVCDKCKIAAFDDFDEACRHEESCLGPSSNIDSPLTDPVDTKVVSSDNAGLKGGINSLHIVETSMSSTGTCSTEDIHVTTTDSTTFASPSLSTSIPSTTPASSYSSPSWNELNIDEKNIKSGKRSVKEQRLFETQVNGSLEGRKSASSSLNSIRQVSITDPLHHQYQKTTNEHIIKSKTEKVLATIGDAGVTEQQRNSDVILPEVTFTETNRENQDATASTKIQILDLTSDAGQRRRSQRIRLQTDDIRISDDNSDVDNDQEEKKVENDNTITSQRSERPARRYKKRRQGSSSNDKATNDGSVATKPGKTCTTLNSKLRHVKGKLSLSSSSKNGRSSKKQKIELNTTSKNTEKKETKSAIITKTPFASIFRSSKAKHTKEKNLGNTNAKTVLAEQRIIEFAIKHRAEAELERERQRRRNKMYLERKELKRKQKEELEIEEVKRLAEEIDRQHKQKLKKRKGAVIGTKVASIFQRTAMGINEKKTTMMDKSATVLEDNPLSFSSTTSIDSFALMASLKQASSSMRLTSVSAPSNIVDLPVAPKFPTPSHVVVSGTSEIEDKNDSDNINKVIIIDQENSHELYLSQAQYTALIQTTKYQSGNNSIESIDAKDYKGSFLLKKSSPSSLFEKESCLINDHSDLLYQAFSSVFQPCSQTIYGIESDETALTDLWSDKYTIKNVPHDVCGSDNKETAEELLNFINEWRDHRQQILETKISKGKKVKGRSSSSSKCKSDDFFYDDFWECDSDEDSDLCNVFLLTGPVGSGKTSLVHAAAKNCECVVLEINTTVVRGGQALKRAVEESTQSHSSLALLRRGNGIEFERLEEGEGEKDGQSLALVLIDEVDLLFENEGDAGFWPALANLTKKAKCPIILTATTIPQPLVNSSTIRFKQLSMTRPTPMECASKMCQISKMEGISWKNSSGTTIKDGLATIAKICDCDLRRIINEMHIFSFSAEQPEKLSNGKYLDTNITVQELNQSASVEFPIISSISPKNVPSGKCSVLTIKGKHFIGTSSTIGQKNKNQFSDYNKIEVYVGGQKCPAVHVLNSSTILAICPPCHIPDGIDSSGISKFNHEESLACKYAQVAIRIISSRGMVLQSNASNCRINDGKYCNIPFITYDFPEYECSIQTRNRNKYEEKKTKARLKRGRAEEENEGFLSSDDGFDCQISTKKHKNIFSKDKDSCKAVVSRNKDETKKDSESNLSGSRCHTGPSEDKMTAQELLEIAVNNCTSIDADDSTSEQSKVVTCSPNSLSLNTGEMDDSSGKILDYLRSAELSSDAALLDDCLNFRCVPLLSGAVPGFGSDLIDDPTFLRSGGAKPPSTEKIFSNGWNESSFYFGCNDTFITRQTSQRDKFLLADLCSNSRGKAKFQTEPIPASVPIQTNNPTCDGEPMLDDSQQAVESVACKLSEEDLLLSTPVSNSMSHLSSILQNAATLRNSEYHSICDDVKLHLAQKEKEQNIFELISLVIPLVGNLDSLNNFHDDGINCRLSLDYIPTLRDMARFESIAERNYLNAMSECQKIISSNRRSTRRSPQGRDHYFEELLQSNVSSNNTELNGKSICEQLAKMGESLLKFSTPRKKSTS